MEKRKKDNTFKKKRREWETTRITSRKERQGGIGS